VTNLPRDRSLFAERATLKLLELSKGYEGVKALKHLERSRRFSSILGGFKDVSMPTIAGINDILSDDPIEDTLVSLFWVEMGRQVVMPETQARITIGLPEKTKPNASCCLELGDSLWKSIPGFRKVGLPYLKMAPFELKGTTPNFADDIAIFDLKATRDNPNPIDLRPYSQFITTGTTISFYYPAPQHEEWFIFARPFQIPPTFILDKGLNVIFAKQVTPDVNCVVYGVEPAVTLQPQS
jgi:hypothetical protein